MVAMLTMKPVQGYYVEYEALDGDMKAVRLLDESFDEGRKVPVIMGGRAIDPTHVPTRILWKDRKKQPMGDLDSGPLLNISDRAKDLIERFEPGVHQFFPVAFTHADGELIENRWLLVVCNRLDTVDREHVQGFLLWRDKIWTPIADYLRDMPDEIPPGYDTSQPSKLVFNGGQIGGAHLWVDKHLQARVWMSDEFAAAGSAAGLTGWRAENAFRETV